MEARAWWCCCFGGDRQQATCVPPVRWLSTTTPAPRSPLHAHRIMCLCVLPPPPPPPPPSRLGSPVPTHDGINAAAAAAAAATTVFVAGDSGGGVAVYELRHSAAAAAVAAETTAVGNASAARDVGLREVRSHPVGRWMAAGKRPVLCLAHARVWPSATHQQQQQQQQQHEVLDLIATGDTGGTVTVWQFYSGGGGGRGGGGSPLPSDHGEFVYRGPAGRRRGGAARTGPEGAAAPPCHALVPVLEYRAHQMGVLCMAVHVPAGEGGRVVIVTGGDDQAICVADLEVVAVLDDGRCSPTTEIASDRGPSSSQGSRGQGGDEVPTRKRYDLPSGLSLARLKYSRVPRGQRSRGCSCCPSTLLLRILPPDFRDHLRNLR
ncbi:unnamed protein product [Ectocarpus sp. 4 AP-2014]